MDRASRLTEIVKRYDKSLYVIRTNEMLQLWRRELPIEIGVPTSARPKEHFIFALTSDWTLKGTPVDWGIEPLLSKLKDSDAWRDDSYYSKMMRERYFQDDNKKRREHNNWKALADDCRRDIARASDEIRFGGIS